MVVEGQKPAKEDEPEDGAGEREGVHGDPVRRRSPQHRVEQEARAHTAVISRRW